MAQTKGEDKGEAAEGVMSSIPLIQSRNVDWCIRVIDAGSVRVCVVGETNQSEDAEAACRFKVSE